MKLIILTKISVFSLALALLSGCADLKVLDPKPDNSRFYYLAAPSNSREAQSAATDISVAITPSTIAKHLDQSQIVTYRDPNRIFYSNENRWAEPLEDNIDRLLVEAIGFALGSSRVGLLMLMGNTAPDYRIGYYIYRLGGEPGKTVELQVSWWIDAASGQPRRYAEKTFSSPVEGDPGDFDAYVQAIQAVIAEWSSNLASSIMELENAPPQ